MKKINKKKKVTRLIKSLCKGGFNQPLPHVTQEATAACGLCACAAASWPLELRGTQWSPPSPPSPYKRESKPSCWGKKKGNPSTAWPFFLCVVCSRRSLLLGRLQLPPLCNGALSAALHIIYCSLHSLMLVLVQELPQWASLFTFFLPPCSLTTWFFHEFSSWACSHLACVFLPRRTLEFNCSMPLYKRLSSP